MVPFIPQNPLSTAELVAATQAMLKIAQTDGITAAETELIRGFYEDGAGHEGCPPFDRLCAVAASGVRLDAGVFAETEHRELLLALCVMTAYADGAFTAAEMQAVRAVAAELGIAEARLAEIVDGVKDHMLAQLSRLPDAGSVAKVAKELG